MGISEKLVSLRKQRRLSQTQVAEFLSEHGIPLTQKGVSKWECGDTMPNAEQFLWLCRLYDIRDVLYVFHGDALEGAELNHAGREKVREYTELLRRDERYLERKEPDPSIELYDLCKTMLENALVPERLEKDAQTPAEADLAIRLGDDSMTPLFAKGSIVYIKKETQIMSGAFGLFAYKGMMYYKLLMENDETELLSVNPAYAPVRIQDKSKLRVIGSAIS